MPERTSSASSRSPASTRSRTPRAGFFLAIAFGLAVAHLAHERCIAFGLVLGFGAVVDILSEVGEFTMMRSGACGLQPTTIQDLVMSLGGTAVGALVTATVLWPAPGTPETLFGRS